MTLMAARPAQRVLGNILVVAGVFTIVAVGLLLASFLFWSLDPDEGPVTGSTWAWALAGSALGAGMLVLGRLLLPRSDARAPRGGW